MGFFIPAFMLKMLHNLFPIASLGLIMYHLKDNFLITFFNYVLDKASFLQFFGFFSMSFHV